MAPRQIEWDYWIPEDVTINSDGTVPSSDRYKVYSFHNNSDRALMSFTGWGMPPIDYITQRGPYQHGETLLTYRLEPRVVQYVYRKTGGCREDYWDNRRELIDAIRPNRSSMGCVTRGRLRKVLPDGSMYDLYAKIERGPVFQGRGQDWDEWSFTETLRFIAHDPVVFNPVQQSASWTLTGGTDQLVFEATFPIFFGPEIVNDTLNITYDGTWLTYPTINITGPLIGPVIKNNSTDETITINYDVPTGETITIDLRYGVKTVENSAGTNLIGTITPNSDLATFHLAPDPIVSGGVNEMVVQGANADANTAVSMTWFDKYIGI